MANVGTSFVSASSAMRFKLGHYQDAGFLAARPPEPYAGESLMNPAIAFRIAALLGFLGVALGAFGAHSLKPLLEKHGALEYWQTAAQYHLAHAVALLFVASRNPLPLLAWSLFVAGVCLFSGSLYLMAVTQWRWLGPVTPVGGLCLLGGWLALALKAR